MSPRMTDWRGRRVWLVGASAGLGAALAEMLAARGAHVILTARTVGPLAAVAARCRERGGTVTVAVADVRSPSQLARVAAKAVELVGGIDYVFYLAAIYSPDGLDALRDRPAAAIDTIDVNLSGALRTVAAVLPGWASPVPAGQRGIVLVASVAGYRGLPRALAYGASKAGLIHLAQSLAIELDARQVGVWVVNPGFIRTRLTARNDFAMPAMVSVDEAAAAILAGMARGAFEIHFPRRFSWVLKLLGWLPDPLYFALIRRVTGVRQAVS